MKSVRAPTAGLMVCLICRQHVAHNFWTEFYRLTRVVNPVVGLLDWWLCKKLILVQFKQNVIFNLGKYIFLSNILKCTRWKYACIPAWFITASFHNQSVMVHLLNSFTISSYTVILKMSLHFPSFFFTNLSIALLLKGRAKNKDRT